MKNNLPAWLNEQLELRGWSQRELARRAGISQTNVSQVMAEQQSPTWEFCAQIAAPLGHPPEDILRLAGLLPSIPAPIAEEHEIVNILRSLPVAIRRTVVTMLRALGKTTAPAIPEPQLPYADDAFIPELLSEFDQVPDDWKPIIIQQIHQFARMADTRPRLIGEEEQPEHETERQPEDN